MLGGCIASCLVLVLVPVAQRCGRRFRLAAPTLCISSRQQGCYRNVYSNVTRRAPASNAELGAVTKRRLCKRPPVQAVTVLFPLARPHFPHFGT